MATAPPITVLWWADSRRNGSTQPFTTNRVNSSITTWTLGSNALATARAAVVLPAPHGPVTMMIGAARLWDGSATTTPSDLLERRPRQQEHLLADAGEVHPRFGLVALAAQLDDD